MEKMESLLHVSMDWITYSKISNYFVEGDLSKKEYYLQKAKDKLEKDSSRYNYLIIECSNFGDVSQGD